MIKNKQWLIKSIKNDLKYGFTFETESESGGQFLWEKYILEDDADFDFVGLEVINKKARWDYQTTITADISYYIIFNDENNEKIKMRIMLTKPLKGFWKPLDYEKNLKGDK